MEKLDTEIVVTFLWRKRKQINALIKDAGKGF